jgi:hypothetical protein
MELASPPAAAMKTSSALLSAASQTRSWASPAAAARKTSSPWNKRRARPEVWRALGQRLGRRRLYGHQRRARPGGGRAPWRRQGRFSPWPSAASQARRRASPLRHSHGCLGSVLPAATTPSSPRRAVVTLRVTWFVSHPKCSRIARSDSPFSPPARGGDSFVLSGSPTSKVSPTRSPNDNKAVPALRSRSKKKRTDASRETARDTQCGPPHILLHQHTIFQNSSFGLLPRFCGVLARSSKSARSSVFQALNSFPFGGGGAQKTHWNRNCKIRKFSHRAAFVFSPRSGLQLS